MTTTTPRPAARLGGRGARRSFSEPLSAPAALGGLAGLSVLLVLAGLVVGLFYVPPSAQVLPLLLGGFVLGRRAMRLLCVVVAAALAVALLVRGLGEFRLGSLLVVGLTAVISYEFARSREDTGLIGLRGDGVLVELRGRLAQQGALPPLPAPWAAEAVVRSAGGAPFAGDFVVSTRVESRFELALVDVSGKGVEAGTRALLLSGALGGLLGSVPPDQFLSAANAYLHRQDWDEGFATAVHLSLDLASGAYAVASAGHPPAAVFHAGSGRWALLEASGLPLGLLEDNDPRPVSGRLDPGDALLMYTDGLVEVPGRDLTVGIDKLIGEAERLVTCGFQGGADVLVTRVAGGGSDDRGLVLLWRRP